MAPLIEASRTDDPRMLGRRIAETIYGIDYRDSRDAYIDAIWAVSLGADTDKDEARAAFADDPALAGIVELIPDADTWARMAEHDQRSVFDVREPIGAEDVEVDAELTEVGVTTTVVLVTGTQRVHYTGDDGTSQDHTVQPSLQMLIGCASRWDGCRLLRVLDRQP